MKEEEKLIGLEYPGRFFYTCAFHDNSDRENIGMPPYYNLDPNIWYCIDDIKLYAQRHIFRWFPPLIGTLYVFKRIDTPEELRVRRMKLENKK